MLVLYDEIRLASTADRTDPGLRQILKSGACRYPPLRLSNGGIINMAADGANILGRG